MAQRLSFFRACCGACRLAVVLLIALAMLLGYALAGRHKHLS